MKKNWPSKFRNLVGDQIRKVRMACRPVVTQEDLAGRLAALGVVLDRSAISRIESRTRIITDYELQAIAEALGVPVGTLFAANSMPKGRLPRSRPPA